MQDLSRSQQKSPELGLLLSRKQHAAQAQGLCARASFGISTAAVGQLFGCSGSAGWSCRGGLRGDVVDLPHDSLSSEESGVQRRKLLGEQLDDLEGTVDEGWVISR